MIDEGVVVPMGRLSMPTRIALSLTGVFDSPVAFFWNFKMREVGPPCWLIDRRLLATLPVMGMVASSCSPFFA